MIAEEHVHGASRRLACSSLRDLAARTSTTASSLGRAVEARFERQARACQFQIPYFYIYSPIERLSVRRH